MLSHRHENGKLSQAIKDDITKVENELREISGGVSQLQSALRSFKDNYEDEEIKNIISWLSGSDHWSKHNDLLNRKQDGIEDSMFKVEEYKRWLDGTTKILCCSEIPEAGKPVWVQV